jgi:hypothetical protein
MMRAGVLMGLIVGLGLAQSAHGDETAQALAAYRDAVLRPVISPIGPAARPRPASMIEAAVLPSRSIDRRLGSNGPVASAGFLCGLQEGVSNRGSASAAGWDPHGRFLGAKLTFAFR